MITAAGVGSGIDIESIISQLMELERQPIEALNRKRERLDVELSAFGSVKSALNDLSNTARTLGNGDTFGPFVATSTDENVFTAEATGGGNAEAHDIEVLALAQNHRLASKAYASAEDTVNTGTWTFSSGDNTFDIEIASGANTLLDLRDAINDSADNTSIVASILNVDGGSRLVLSANESGTAREISLGGIAALGASPSGGVGGIGATPAGPGFEEVTEAADAELIIDGFSVTGSSNTVSDVLTGVTLQLKGVGEATLSTARNTESLRESLDEFVTGYNDLRSQLGDLSEDELSGDRLPRNIESRLREAFFTPVTLNNGETVQPTTLGFSFDRYGVLSIEETRLAEAQKVGLEAFIQSFTAADVGLAQRFEDVFEPYTQSGGLISGREDGIDNRKRSIDDQIDRLDYRLIQTEQRYRRQFTAMDQLVSDLQSTSSFLVSRLGADTQSP